MAQLLGVGSQIVARVACSYTLIDLPKLLASWKMASTGTLRCRCLVKPDALFETRGFPPHGLRQ
ncbi:MAG: hypothetical protein ACU0B9_15705 [Limimaricola soesokkakensis]|uniref:hypothetical protein n=1 Tax=Limimaricola soesokkakensis TaxID=1343159 RepID=UPI004059C619